ncbi:MAG: hypothetical protein N2662_02160 [Bacteroidales bacterium]|nr:hypothetical protein [Bacteroidales bacterium]
MRADGEGGILFYIILGLVGLIVSYLQNKAKPKQPTPTDFPEEPRDVWKELLDWEEEQEPHKSEPQVTIKQTVKDSESKTLEGPVFMDAQFEGVSVFSTPNVALHEQAYHISEQPPTFYADLIKDTEITDIAEEYGETKHFNFNLREAVIYSEILNRKY